MNVNAPNHEIGIGCELKHLKLLHVSFKKGNKFKISPPPPLWRVYNGTSQISLKKFDNVIIVLSKGAKTQEFILLVAMLSVTPPSLIVFISIDSCKRDRVLGDTLLWRVA